MPLYEYKCQSCSEVFEVMQKFSDEPLQVHEGCGGPLERLIGSPTLQFKGAGWYVNDYAKGGTKQGHASQKSPAGGSDGSGAAKTESKPAPSSPAKSE